jgi:hypothetical protein
MAPTVVCMVCQKVLTQGPANGPLSHGLGPCCWAEYREANGLAARPYPTHPVVVA